MLCEIIRNGEAVSKCDRICILYVHSGLVMYLVDAISLFMEHHNYAVYKYCICLESHELFTLSYE
jgi:hypothetical protein